ncbi:MAG: hypothetical protein V7636_327, partial [Actinomycetota bacterium]
MSDQQEIIDALVEPEPELTPSVEPTTARGLRGILHEWRPSIITGGAAAGPIVILSLLNAADELDRSAFG